MIAQDWQSFPAPAKINLFLHVVGRLSDGYHALQTAMVLLDFADTINVRLRQDGLIRRVGKVAGVAPDEDLAIRAARILQQQSATKWGADIEVIKRIPMGGGFGGGSSDAATVLLVLNRLWGINYGRSTLMSMGLALGADVPFFLFGCSAWGEARGEALVSLPIDCSACGMVIFVPKRQVSTARVFGDPFLSRDTAGRPMAQFIGDWQAFNENLTPSLAPSGWHNDLQKVAERLFPDLASIPRRWQEALADYFPDPVLMPHMAMTGSGSGYFSILNACQCEKIIGKAKASRLQKTENFAYNSPPFLDGWAGQLGLFTRVLSHHPLYDWVVEA